MFYMGQFMSQNNLQLFFGILLHRYHNGLTKQPHDFRYAFVIRLSDSCPSDGYSHFFTDCFKLHLRFQITVYSLCQTFSDLRI